MEKPEIDKEVVNYIRDYFSNLMTDGERLALNHHIYTSKSSGNIAMRNMMIKRSWINSEPEIINLLKNGYEEFMFNVVKRIMAEAPEKVFFNNCPKCNRLARTPKAKQCRYCGHTWRDTIVAQFKLENAFQVTGRQFFLIGKIIKGEISKVQLMDLTALGLNKKVQIKSIEFAFKHQDKKVFENIGLGTDELTEEDKQYLKSINSFKVPFEIISDHKDETT